MLPELRQYFRLWREGQLPDEGEVAEFMGMGGVYRAVQRHSLVRLMSKARASRSTVLASTS